MTGTPAPSTTTPPPILGVIDTFSQGIWVVVRHPLLLLLPILLDLFFWFAPPLVLGPEVINRLLSTIPRQGETSTLSEDEAAEWVTILDEQLHSVNIWGMGISPLLFWPTVMAGHPLSEEAPPSSTLPLDTMGSVLEALSLLGLTGLLLNVFWLNGVAQSVRGKQAFGIGRWLRNTWRHWVRFILLGLLMGMAALGALLPLSFGLGMVMLLLPGLGEVMSGLVATMMVWGILWLGIYLYFTVAAVVLANQGVLRAPLASMALLRHFFWSALGFIGISLLLNGGFQLIWMGMDDSVLGRVVSIFGNAALGTAIVAATFIFFAQRYQLLMQKARAAQPAAGNDG